MVYKILSTYSCKKSPINSDICKLIVVTRSYGPIYERSWVRFRLKEVCLFSLSKIL